MISTWSARKGIELAIMFWIHAWPVLYLISGVVHCLPLGSVQVIAYEPFKGAELFWPLRGGVMVIVALELALVALIELIDIPVICLKRVT